MQDKELQQEDTVSADRKVRIIIDPKTGKRKTTSAVMSRQNFDAEKFGNRSKVDDEDAEEVKESAIQPTGTSQIDVGATERPADSKKSSSQIKFVTGNQVVTSGTAIGNAQNMGIKKISEALVKKALTQVKADKNVGTEEIPFDGPYTKTSGDVVDKSGAHHTPSSRARHLARQAMSKQMKKEEVELGEGVTGAVAGGVLGAMVGGPLGAVAGSYLGHKTQQGANASKDVKKKVVNEEETDMSEKLTYAQFVEQLLEYTPGPGGITRVRGKSYGANYDAGEDEDDKPAAPAVKRGRGRPAGSKSGANQKVTTGKSYGGIATHSLHLPNSK